MQYRRTPTSSGYSPSELLNSRQLRTRLDALLPSPAYAAQGKQAREATKSQQTECLGVAKVTRQYKVGDTVYARYCGPRCDKQPRWVPAIVKKCLGTRSFNVKVLPCGPVWRRHLEQLQPRYATDEDNDPGDTDYGSTAALMEPTDHPMELQARDSSPRVRPAIHRDRPANRRKPSGPEYGPDNPRRSKRASKPRDRLCL